MDSEAEGRTVVEGNGVVNEGGEDDGASIGVGESVLIVGADLGTGR